MQSSIKCWIESHQSELLRNGLNEDHYNIKAVKSVTAVIVYVECKLCHTIIKLQPKSTKKAGVHYGISNWTKHVALCYFKSLKDSGQTKLVFKPIKVDSSGECSSSQNREACSLTSTLVGKVVACSDKKISKRPSRSECAQRQLLKAASDPCQTHITDYFQVLNDVEKLLQANAKLCDLLQQYRKD